jgi:putative hydrolase of the HAD superfamily|tara:strand:- start:716 stop:1318 length:603 start_codon:yes stop_codon:yes gene_type:complete
MIKTIIFDFGGVYFTDGVSRIMKIICSRYNLPMEKVKECFEGPLGFDYRLGNIDKEEFWDRTKKFLGITANTEELSQEWNDQYEPIEGTVKIVDRLKDAGYDLLFLSNNLRERVSILDSRYGFLQKFKNGIFSFDVKIKKPDPKIYLALLKKTSSSAEECLYVDDKERCTKSAEQVGMKTILFESPEKLEEDLKKFSLNF